MPSESESSAFEKNTREQYEELGRFVEAFEAMVSQVRNTVIFILAGLDLSKQTFVSVVLHHGSLTAKPLFEIMRTLLAEVAKDEAAREQYTLDDKDQEVLRGVLAKIEKEYMHLANTRNNLLHGTWYVGYLDPTDDPEGTQFYINKLAMTQKGIKSLDLPKTADELRHLRRSCEKLNRWISTFEMPFFLAGAMTPKTMFWYDDKEQKWFKHGDGVPESLP